ncbi:hypothetical protein MKQ70_03420 [Chitinophaga sedimenti]|uniref:hypothetical protein n=1 Tax=Chitinophaga sedimenti TaxID=2033606 RepID=UPI002005DC02|nr:hypothetical protein [Chitinophaga sedimenti]MCK7554110.1 hypothetical protein [Chitinophaga sedimenti]
MMKILNYIAVVAALLTMSACDLNELPVDTATNDAVFGSESGLELYTNSFYDLLPGTDVGVFQDDDNSDLVARNGVDNYRRPAHYRPSPAPAGRGPTFGTLITLSKMQKKQGAEQRSLPRHGPLLPCTVLF